MIVLDIALCDAYAEETNIQSVKVTKGSLCHRQSLVGVQKKKTKLGF